MKASSALSNLILEEARARFSDAAIMDVEAEFEEDSDGDEILKIMIVFDNETGRLNPDALVSFVRHLRTALENREEERFPLVSYLWMKDQKGLATAR